MRLESVFFVFQACISFSYALDNGVGLTPPMGFNSYMANLHGEQGLGLIADYFVKSGLKEKGFVYINTDEGCESKTRLDSNMIPC